MRHLPSGTITFLFTDVEGSTKLLHELGDEAYAEALLEHRRVLRDVFSAHGGVEVDTQGDAFFVAFPTAPGALAAAAAALEGLSTSPIRVRVGVHTGTPLVGEEGYVGVDVHRAARIAAAGHGGQVLISASTAALLDTDELRDLGDHRLKDLTQPQRLYQLVIPGLESEFPALKTTRPPTNLPAPPTPLVGRERELAEARSLLAREDVRLLTLTGAGGSGKTRLAVHAAAELIDDYRDGVWWVSLAALHDPELVEPTIARVVGAEERLGEHLGGKRMLLVLDNFEQLLVAAPLVSSLLAEAPDLRVLATSRERLGLTGEQEYAVPTMVPAEAVALFTARARQLKHAFEPADAVKEICRRLDGLPLAIELAAARVKVLTPEQILERLSESLDLLTTSARDAPERHRTLRATIDWSYDLLDVEERQLFGRLAVFATSFDLEAAEAVCDAALETLEALSEKSLIRHTGDRFSMLETIREYAVSRLATSQEETATRRRHAEHYAAVGETLGWSARNSEPEALQRLGVELNNIRAALAWSLADRQIHIAQRLLEGAWWIWLTRGFAAEGDRWARAVFDQTSGVSIERAMAASLAGEFARFRGDLERAITLKEQALELYKAADGDAGDLAATLTDLAETLIAAGDLKGGEAAAEQALALRRERGVDLGITHAERPFLLVAMRTGKFARAEELATRAVSIYRGAEYWSDLADALVLLASARRREGDLLGASAYLREALAVALRVNDEFVALDALEEVAAVLASRGEFEQAARLLAASEQRRESSGLLSTDPSERERLLRVLGPHLASGSSLEVHEAMKQAIAYLE